jgi:hypothetical protein
MEKTMINFTDRELSLIRTALNYYSGNVSYAHKDTIAQMRNLEDKILLHVLGLEV